MSNSVMNYDEFDRRLQVGYEALKKLTDGVEKSLSFHEFHREYDLKLSPEYASAFENVTSVEILNSTRVSHFHSPNDTRYRLMVALSDGKPRLLGFSQPRSHGPFKGAAAHSRLVANFNAGMPKAQYTNFPASHISVNQFEQVRINLLLKYMERAVTDNTLENSKFMPRTLYRDLGRVWHGFFVKSGLIISKTLDIIPVSESSYRFGDFTTPRVHVEVWQAHAGNFNFSLIAKKLNNNGTVDMVELSTWSINPVRTAAMTPCYLAQIYAEIVKVRAQFVGEVASKETKESVIHQMLSDRDILLGVEVLIVRIKQAMDVVAGEMQIKMLHGDNLL